MKQLSLALAVVVFAMTGCASQPAQHQAPNVVRAYQTKNGDRLVLLDTPCVSTEGALANLIDDLRPRLKAAEETWQGKDYAACWMKDGEHTIIVDSAGDVGAIEGSPFEPLGI